MKPLRVLGGFAITPSLIRSIVTNPIYLGWRLVNGEVVRQDNHALPVGAEIFWQAQERLGPGSTAPRLWSGAIQILAGLLYCARHGLPQRMRSVRLQGQRAYGRYRCCDAFDTGQADQFCTALDARLVNEPGPGQDLSVGASIYPAVQNLMVAARAFGVGSALTTIHRQREDEVRAILGIPENVQTAALIPLGYPRGRWGVAQRRPVEEVVHMDTWGEPWRGP